ncbi:MAG: MazG nucleotide pyrophosphohydrolase domain-containing protein [Acidimicrobiales bacterium]
MVARVVVVGLGPAGPELVDPVAACLLRGGDRAVLRTRRHPAAAGFEEIDSFDRLYESHDDFGSLYGAMVEELVEAGAGGRIVLAVPGSPLVAERCVELLRRRDDVELEVHPALSFLDLAWARLAVDPVACSVRLVDAQELPVAAAGERGPLLVAQCWSAEVLSGVKLAVDSAPEAPVTLLHHLGLADEAVVECAWEDLDRCLTPDHLTSLWIPELAAPVGVELARLRELARTLRQRCPWDAEQTHSSLGRHLREETYEVLEAIASLGPGGAGYDELEEELGDVLYQVFFHAQLAAEAGMFDMADVARGVHDKLVARHPHVFGDAQAADSEAVRGLWEERKRAEKSRASVLDGIPSDLPALAYAQTIERRGRHLQGAAGGGDAAPLDRLVAAVQDAAGEAGALGELLYQVAKVAAGTGVDAEEALRRAARAHGELMRSSERSGPPATAVD